MRELYIMIILVELSPFAYNSILLCTLFKFRKIKIKGFDTRELLQCIPLETELNVHVTILLSVSTEFHKTSRSAYANQC